MRKDKPTPPPCWLRCDFCYGTGYALVKIETTNTDTNNKGAAIGNKHCNMCSGTGFIEI